MKTIGFKIAMICSLIVGFKQQSFTQEIAKGAQITFVKDTHDFGEVPYDQNPVYTFEFTNTGNEPLFIAQVRWSCSCQMAEWSTEPILPGKKGIIKVRYDSRRVGPITKNFRVFSNAINESSKDLFIRGKILSDKISDTVSTTN